MAPVQIDLVSFGVAQMLDSLGIDWVNDPELADTPTRVARFYQEFLEYHDPNMDTVFASAATDQMVAVTDIDAWSLCAHHLLPFHCRISCAYISGEKVLGLSKMPRIVQQKAHALQTQERLVTQIADAIGKVLGHDDVAVIADGEHSCVAMRGIRSPATMHTSVLRGAFQQPATRNELMELMKR